MSTVSKEDIEALKEIISKASKKKSEIEGAISTYKDTLEKEFGLSDVSEIEGAIGKLETQIDEMNMRINEEWEKIKHIKDIEL